MGEGGPESRVVRNTFETLLVLGNSTLPSENKAICDFYQDQISRAGRQDSLGLNYILIRSDLGFVFAEIFVIEKRLFDSPSRGVDKNAYRNNFFQIFK